MSVIRDALKKGADEVRPPVSAETAPAAVGKGKERYGFSLKRGWILAGLLFIFFGGGMMYVLSSSESTANKTPDFQLPQPKVRILEGLSRSPSSSTSKEGPALSALSSPPPRVVSLFQPRGASALGKKTKTSSGEKREKNLKTPEPVLEKGPEEGPTALTWFNEAVRAQERKEYDRALQAYRRVLALRPSHVETYNNLGLMYLEQNQTALAREMFEKALILHPRYLKGMNNLGLTYLREGRWEEAGEQFRRVLDVHPAFLPALINLAAALSRQGQREQARQVLLRVLDFQSDHPEACYNLGLLWEQEGNGKKALEYYRTFFSKGQGTYPELVEELKGRFPELR